jgi:hypothetical protein
MILFPAMMVGGSLLVAVVDRVPDLNFEPICRESAGPNLNGKDSVGICRSDEGAARDALAKQWTEFDATDRARCVRLSTTNNSASYVEVLTCLEMNRDAKKLRQKEDAGIALGEPAHPVVREKPSPAAPGVRVARQPVSAPPQPASPPLSLEPRPTPASGFLQLLCVPGLKSIVPACASSGDRP